MEEYGKMRSIRQTSQISYRIVLNYFLPLCALKSIVFSRPNISRILFVIYSWFFSPSPVAYSAKASPSQKVKERRTEGRKGRKEGRRRHECVRMKCIYARHRHVGKDRRLRAGPGVRVGE